ncbi:hypothetical protein IQ247_17725 [Plectonema cf. radiosum LEGE 06105]|uniref:CARDB domain-containing protein n=1 Tax=Plectonema cf. radiosum LEGE 06105 TaxID=945769 RepID=A0A8J7F3V9_9CYAN|nr:CARDB domain-containing protein [Plectonema radiosum]MBE9214485.1 hypothetical protein [Plectonema cf. radiosum LEGE 06105]
MGIFSRALKSALPIILTAVSLNLTIPGEAQAYSTSSCLGKKLKWDSNSKTLRANSKSFPAGTIWENALKTAIARLNQNPSNFNYELTTDRSSRRFNRQSEVWGSTNNRILKGAPAVAYVRRTCYWLFGKHVKLKELDVVFDYGSPWRWDASELKSNLIGYAVRERRDPLALRPFQTTAIHELGHGLKLNHVNSEYNVMGRDFEHIHVNGSQARAYLGEDAADGAVALYGTRSPARQDLGVVHWKYNSASGEYSDHTKTQLFNSANAVLSNFNDSPDNRGETRYRVNPGQQVRTEFSYENNGASTQSNVRVGFYISTNDTISTTDQRIGGTTLDLGRGNVNTARHTVTIPSSLRRNRNYWLGVIVDENNSISENVEWNNATYIPIKTE